MFGRQLKRRRRTNPWAQPCSNDTLNLFLEQNSGAHDRSPLGLLGGPNDLSTPASESVLAVHRALGISIDGCDPWQSWKESEGDFTSVEHACRDDRQPDPVHAAKVRPSPLIDVTNAGNACVISIGSDLLSSTSSLTKQPSLTARHLAQKNEHCSAKVAAVQTSKLVGQVTKPVETALKTKVAAQAQKETDLTKEDTTHAKAIQSWLHITSQSLLPQASFKHLRQSSTNFEALLQIILTSPSKSTSKLPSSSSLSQQTVQLPNVSTLASLLTALTDYVPTHLANIVYSLIIFPYLKSLTSPALRDMLNAIILFTQRHWRFASCLVFSPFVTVSGPNTPVLNKSIIEILIKIAESSLPQPTCKQVLSSLCNPNSIAWTDPLVPLIDILVMRVTNKVKLKSEKNSATNDVAHDGLDNEQEINELLVHIMTGMEINSKNLERSVRFSKLIYNLVKDMSTECRQLNQARIISICKSNKQFLAKRALTILQS